jgi:hypothetical protein
LKTPFWPNASVPPPTVTAPTELLAPVSVCVPVFVLLSVRPPVEMGEPKVPVKRQCLVAERHLAPAGKRLDPRAVRSVFNIKARAAGD